MKKTRQKKLEEKLEEKYRIVKEEYTDGKYISESAEDHMKRLLTDIKWFESIVPDDDDFMEKE